MKETYQPSPGGESLELDALSSAAEELAVEIHVINLTPVEGRIKAIIESAKTKLEKYEVLDKYVRCGLRMFVEVGLALDEINRSEFWVEAGHVSWKAYCINGHGISKSHANRLIISAKIATYLAKQTPDGFKKKDMEARNESQMRPLAPLEKKEQWVEAWCQAVRKAGGQPTQEIVASVVNEMIGCKGPKRSLQPSLGEIVQEVIARIRILMDEGRPNQEIQKLLDELDEAAKSKTSV